MRIMRRKEGNMVSLAPRIERLYPCQLVEDESLEIGPQRTWGVR